HGRHTSQIEAAGQFCCGLLQLITRVPLYVVWDGGHGENAHDRDSDHHFDQRKTPLIADSGVQELT
ncbi:MAG: hypothetical protein K0S58_641, partial [Nitrospira sp.]|nr:hypothetical protein [Nitrospira sp.]